MCCCVTKVSHIILFLIKYYVVTIAFLLAMTHLLVQKTY